MDAKLLSDSHVFEAVHSDRVVSVINWHICRLFIWLDSPSRQILASKSTHFGVVDEIGSADEENIFGMLSDNYHVIYV